MIYLFEYGKNCLILKARIMLHLYKVKGSKKNNTQNTFILTSRAELTITEKKHWYQNFQKFANISVVVGVRNFAPKIIATKNDC